MSSGGASDLLLFKKTLEGGVTRLCQATTRGPHHTPWAWREQSGRADTPVTTCYILGGNAGNVPFHLTLLRSLRRTRLFFFFGWRTRLRARKSREQAGGAQGLQRGRGLSDGCRPAVPKVRPPPEPRPVLTSCVLLHRLSFKKHFKTVKYDKDGAFQKRLSSSAERRLTERRPRGPACARLRSCRRLVQGGRGPEGGPTRRGLLQSPVTSWKII